MNFQYTLKPNTVLLWSMRLFFECLQPQISLLGVRDHFQNDRRFRRQPGNFIPPA